MKKLSIFGSLILLAAGSYHYFSPSELEIREAERQAYEDYINKHPFSQREHMTRKELKQIPKKDRPDLAAEQDYLLTMDPVSKRPQPEKIAAYLKQQSIQHSGQAKAMQQVAPGSVNFPWEERGPDNVAGRTRALMFDPNDSTYNKVWAGGVTGGLWYNDSIYDSSAQWHGVSQLWENIPISAICYDPIDPQTFYAGTGEGFGGRSGVGAGIWKSTDAGTTWNLIPESADYKIINDLMVRQEGDSSVLYVASDRLSDYNNQGHGVRGLFKSTDGGITYTEIKYNNNSITSPADFEMGADNTLWIGTVAESGKIFSLADTTNSVLVQEYSLSSGDRVEIATAESDSNYVYAIIEQSGGVGRIIRTTDHGANWTILNKPNDADNGISAADFSRGQAWYDLIIEVDPNDKEAVVAGAIDLFRSGDGGTSWDQLSHWWGGFGYPYVHADQHGVFFRPGSSDTCLFTNDGGVFYANSMTFPNPAMHARNNGYNVTQFYACDIHPDAGENNYIAGAQDNGTQEFSDAGMNSTDELYGGDGGYCFIDQLDPDFKIVSYVYNSYYYTSGGGFGTMLDEDFGGFFINPAAYDSKVGMLYSSRSTGSFYRSTVDGFDYHSQSQMGRATHFAVSPYAAPDTSTIFVGTVNGKVWKFVNASDSSQFVTSTELTYSGFPNGSISCIAIGSSEDELLVTFSNYNTASVWYTGDGGDNWEMVEGNLPDMPVRWALFNPLNWNQVLLATELGTWSTINIHEPSVNWTQSINGMENVRVNMLRTRNSDNQVVAATFGRGLFTSFGFQEAYLPIAGFESTENQICLGQFVTLKDTSTHVVDSREWIISPNTVSFINGTDSTSKFPQVEFNIEGDYTIKLVVTNVNGSDSITYTNFISAVELDPEIIHNFNPDKLTCSITANSYQWFLNGNVLNGETNQEYFPNTNGTFRVEAILNEDCSEKSPGFVLENFGLNDLSTSAIDLWYSNAMQSLVLNLPEGYKLGENQLTVTDANGRMVYQEVVESTEVSMQTLSPGVYFAKISAENTKDTGLKFIIR